jgi:hypothetical protein
VHRGLVALGAVAVPALGLPLNAFAFDLSQADASSGVRAALERGAVAAVGQLGQADGFLANPLVKIELPGALRSAAKLLRATGQGHRVDELVTAMNRAAEAAVPQAKTMLVNAAKGISVKDAVGIVRGGETSVTDYFSRTTRQPLALKFTPIVADAMQKVSLASKFEAVAGKVSKLGLIDGKNADLKSYVTGKALDGLYKMIAEEEKKIRQDPIGTGSAILRRVFGR